MIGSAPAGAYCVGSVIARGTSLSKPRVGLSTSTRARSELATWSAQVITVASVQVDCAGGEYGGCPDSRSRLGPAYRLHGCNRLSVIGPADPFAPNTVVSS